MGTGTATWGIPGPVFVIAWVILFVIAVALPHVLVARAARRPPKTAVSSDPRDLSAEQLAVLISGPRRAVEVAVARLIECGRLRVSRGRVLTVTNGSGPAEESDLDAAVLHAVGPGTRMHRVVAGVERTRAVAEVSEQLVARGLLVDPNMLRARRLLGRIVLGLVVLLGLVRIAAGLARGAPTVVLIIVLILFVCLSIGFLRVGVHRLTASGAATAAELAAGIRGLATAERAGTAPGGRATAVLPLALVGAAGLVAIGGLAAYPDAHVSVLLAFPNVAAGWSGSSSDWSSDSGFSDSGSSCGSSDSGSSCGSSSCGSSCGGGGGCGG